jgi:hypothetical protein
LRTRTRGLAALTFAGLFVLMPATAALAHESATIGHLEVEVGFQTEPAYVGQPNAALISIMHEGRPVLDLGDQLKVELAFGDTTSEPLTPEPAFGLEDGKLEFGEPGTYVAPFVPTQPGKYTFHFTGSIDGEKVDRSFTSSPDGFDEVQDPATVNFPPVDVPSAHELTTRIERESERAASAAADAVDARDAADSARTVAMIGVALGALGVIAAIAALAIRRKAS